MVCLYTMYTIDFWCVLVNTVPEKLKLFSNVYMSALLPNKDISKVDSSYAKPCWAILASAWGYSCFHTARIGDVQ